MIRTSLSVLLLAVSISVQTVSGQVSLLKSAFHGRESISLQNGNMRISMLTGGAYIAELRMINEEGNESVNPMFIPHYKTIDPHTYTPEKHKDLYGSGINGKLMAGYMGHYLCFPRFGGNLSVFEENAGHTMHGEAYTVKYKVEESMQDDRAIIMASAVLPLTRYAVTRSLTLLPGQPVVLVEESIKNLEPFDRPYHYVQHITFGQPFVEYGKTYVDAPVSRIGFSPRKDDPLNSNKVEWPLVRTKGGLELNAGIFGTDKGEGGYRAWLMDPERDFTWLTVYNPSLKLLVGYIFPKAENPWIGDWQENHRAQALPRNGKTVAWGLEVGTTPFGSGVRQTIERGPLFDTETYQWIGANEEKVQSYLIFLLEIPEDFKGVNELKLDDGTIILSEKDATKQIRIAHSFTPW